MAHKEETHVCSLRLDTQTYGWFVRYCQANDVTMSQVMRKALKIYRIALENKGKKNKEVIDGEENVQRANEKI